MVRRSKGIMSNTRRIFRKHPRERGMVPITNYLHEFDVGEKANIIIDSSSQKVSRTIDIMVALARSWANRAGRT